MMKIPIKVLIITEEYVDYQRPELGFTNSMHNLIATLQASGFPSTYEHLLMSPECLWSSDALNHEVLTRDYDCAVISPIYITQPSARFIIPAPGAVKAGKTCILWWDSVWYGFDTLMHSYPMCHNLVFDRWYGEEHPTFHGIQVPQDPNVFYKNDTVEDLDVTFAGRLDQVRDDRNNYLHFLRIAGINPYIGGGRGRGLGNLTPQDYASLFRRSKICLNFAKGHGTIQRKGRIFEIAACGKFMMTNYPETVGKFFTEGEDYIAFNEANIADKIRYYLANEKERNEIANNMHEKYVNNYMPEHFWGKIFNLCGVI